jgi:hypothetical protein
LEEYGKEEFSKFFSHVCTMPHVKKLIHNEEILTDAKLSHVVHRRLKVALKDVIWRPKFQAVMWQWFSVLNEATGKVMASLDTYSNLGNLNRISVCDKMFPKTCYLCNLYKMEFESKTLITILDEAKVCESMYTNSEVYNILGKEVCIVQDIALAKGGTEAIVESFYSTMASQSLQGGQSNEVLTLRWVIEILKKHIFVAVRTCLQLLIGDSLVVFRTKIDWCFPPVIQLDTAITEIAKIYIDGDKQLKLKSHMCPVLGERAVRLSSYKRSKVVDKLLCREVKLPFLL